MTRVTELTPLLKQLRLGQMAATLPERIALARREQLDYAGDPARGPHRSPPEWRRFRGDLPPGGLRLVGVRHPGPPPWASSHWSFCTCLVGPAGVGASWPRPGYSAVRAGHTVRFSHADDFFRAMAQPDNSVDRAFRSFLTPDLLILDDLGLLTAQQGRPLRTHPQPPPVLQLHHHQQPGRRRMGAWPRQLPDRSYRERLSPHRALLNNQGGD